MSPVRPPGVHARLCALAILAPISVEFAVVSVPVLCLAREAWYAAASPGDNTAATGNLSLDELQDARCDYLGMCDKVISSMQQGPHRAVRAALVRWACSAPVVLTGADGTAHDVTMGAPASLSKFVLRDFQAASIARADQHLRANGHLGQGSATGDRCAASSGPLNIWWGSNLPLCPLWQESHQPGPGFTHVVTKWDPNVLAVSPIPYSTVSRFATAQGSQRRRPAGSSRESMRA